MVKSIKGSVVLNKENPVSYIIVNNILTTSFSKIKINAIVKGKGFYVWLNNNGTIHCIPIIRDEYSNVIVEFETNSECFVTFDSVLRLPENGKINQYEAECCTLDYECIWNIYRKSICNNCQPKFH